MAANNFARALKAVLAHEGGYVDHPKDPGGATNLGVTIGTLSAWLGRKASKGEVKALTVEAVKPIYRANYWDAIRGDDLPSGVDYAVFDFAVNSGPARAAIYLQNIVGTAPDGKIGPITVKAVAAYVSRFGAAQLVNELCSQRLAFLQRLSTWPTFGKGWGRRVAEVRVEAMAMTAAAPSKPVDHVAPSNPPTPVPSGQRKASGALVAFIAIIILVAAAAFFFVRF